MKNLPEMKIGYLLRRFRKWGGRCFWPELEQHWTLTNANEVESLKGRYVPFRNEEWQFSYQADSGETHELWDGYGFATWYKGPDGYSGIKVLESSEGTCLCEVITKTYPANAKVQETRQLQMVLNIDGTHSWPENGEHYIRQDEVVAESKVQTLLERKKEKARLTVKVEQVFDKFLDQVSGIVGGNDEDTQDTQEDVDEDLHAAVNEEKRTSGSSTGSKASHISKGGSPKGGSSRHMSEGRRGSASFHLAGVEEEERKGE